MAERTRAYFLGQPATFHLHKYGVQFGAAGMGPEGGKGEKRRGGGYLGASLNGMDHPPGGLFSHVAAWALEWLGLSLSLWPCVGWDSWGIYLSLHTYVRERCHTNDQGFIRLHLQQDKAWIFFTLFFHIYFQESCWSLVTRDILPGPPNRGHTRSSSP